LAFEETVNRVIVDLIPGRWEALGDRGMIVVLGERRPASENSLGEGEGEEGSDGEAGEHGGESSRAEKRSDKSA
jgi:hypothetical protein